MARKAAAQVAEGATPPEEPPVLTESVEVDLGEDIQSPDSTVVETVTSPPEPPQTPPTPPTPSPPEDTEKNDLRRRLKEVEDAAAASAREALEAKQALGRGEQQSQKQVFDAQYDALVNSMGGYQADLAAAKRELVVAGNDQDWERIGELHERIGRASSLLSQAEQTKERMDNWLENQKRQPQRQASQPQPRPQQTRQKTAAEIISEAPIPDSAKAWLRQHEEFITDEAKNQKLQSMHHVAKHNAGGEFTDAYFHQMDVLLGFKQDGAATSNGSAGQPMSSPQRQSAPVSAPPTREAPSMSTGRSPTSTKVTLSAAEREIAATIAVSRGMTQAEAEREYAKQKLEMQKAKADGRISQ